MKGEESQTVNPSLSPSAPVWLSSGEKTVCGNRLLAATLARSDPNAIRFLQELYVPLI